MQIWRCLVWAAALAACGDSAAPVLVDAAPPDAAPDPDAISLNLPCVTDPVPTTGADSYVISGAIRNFADDAPIAGASVDLRHSGTSLGVFTTDSTGQFMTTVNTGFMAYELEERATATGYVPTQLFTP